MAADFNAAIADYIGAFETADDDFLFYYHLDANGGITRHSWSRGAFWQLARKGAHVLRTAGLKAGGCFCLCVGANQPYDLALRLGAVMTGTTAVTVNWQADSLERICYKIQLTESKLIVSDDVFNPAHLAAVQKHFPDIPVFNLAALPARETPDTGRILKKLPADATRLIVFTSGTTGRPKGVELSYRSYQTNRAAFEQFLQIRPADRFAVLIVNPLHHSNSSAITDWAMRRPGTHIHLIQRYATSYWKILARVADGPYDRLVAPTVPRHFDFLEGLDRAKRLPLPAAALKAAMRRVDFLIGSAPVGPTTIQRLQRYAGRIPAVRFGATETCLQSIGIPTGLPEKAKKRAFEKGWRHRIGEDPQPGYYIGRPHPPHTAARIVESITAGEAGFMQDCDPGQPGYLIVAGGHLMSAYTGQPEQTRAVFHGKWYTGLKDIGFMLVSEQDGELDYYWMSRESMLLIRGGANYAYEQLNHEIKTAIRQQYGLAAEDLDLAVVGLKLASEHEDACCLTVEAKSPRAEKKLPEDAGHLKSRLNQTVSRGARADHLRYGRVPRNFKGAVLVKQLAAEYERWLQQTG